MEAPAPTARWQAGKWVCSLLSFAKPCLGIMIGGRPLRLCVCSLWCLLLFSPLSGEPWGCRESICHTRQWCNQPGLVKEDGGWIKAKILWKMPSKERKYIRWGKNTHKNGEEQEVSKVYLKLVRYTFTVYLHPVSATFWRLSTPQSKDLDLDNSACRMYAGWNVISTSTLKGVFISSPRNPQSILTASRPTRG